MKLAWKQTKKEERKPKEVDKRKIKERENKNEATTKMAQR
jgi:hypothetical protein